MACVTHNLRQWISFQHLLQCLCKSLLFLYERSCYLYSYSIIVPFSHISVFLQSYKTYILVFCLFLTFIDLTKAIFFFVNLFVYLVSTAKTFSEYYIIVWYFGSYGKVLYLCIFLWIFHGLLINLYSFFQKSSFAFFFLAVYSYHCMILTKFFTGFSYSMLFL